MSYELDKQDFVSVYPSWIVWNISKWYFEKNVKERLVKENMSIFKTHYCMKNNKYLK